MPGEVGISKLGTVSFGLGWVLRNLKGDGSTMASENEIERKRGAVESRERVESLRERWPLAFPIARADVRPLAIGSHKIIADAMGCSLHAGRACRVERVAVVLRKRPARPAD
jgi:hypothetical protein